MLPLRLSFCLGMGSLLASVVNSTVDTASSKPVLSGFDSLSGFPLLSASLRTGAMERLSWVGDSYTSRLSKLGASLAILDVSKKSSLDSESFKPLSDFSNSVFFMLSQSSSKFSDGTRLGDRDSDSSTWLIMSCTMAFSSRPPRPSPSFRPRRLVAFSFLFRSFLFSCRSFSSSNPPGMPRSLDPGGESRRRYVGLLMTIEGSKPASSAVAANVAANSASSS